MKNKGNCSVDPAPEFFRIYLPLQCKDHMELPVAFNSFLAKPLPKNVTVRSRCGDIWTMALRKTGDRVFLRNGWKQFIKDADLKGCEFLVFEYDGSQAFKVNIFDCSTLARATRSVQIQKIKKHKEEEAAANDDDDGDDGDGDGDDDDDEVEESANNDEEQAKDGNGEQGCDYIDVEDEERKETREGGVKKEKKTRVRRGSYRKDYKDEYRKYLDNPMNPFFAVNLTRKRTHELQIPSFVIKDYDLKFPEFIKFIDPIGTLRREVGRWKSKHVFVRGFNSVILRNNVKQTDKVICEVVTETEGRVRAIKIHIICG